MKTPLTAWLLANILEFMDLNGMEGDGCMFGWYVMHDRNLVSRLQDGKDISVRILEACLSFMQNPVTVIHSGDRKGELKPLQLKPLNIKRRMIP